MFNPDTAPYFNYYLQPFQAAARASALEPITAEVRSVADVERTVASVSGRPDTGLVVHRSKIASNLAPSSESACVERSVPLHPRWTLNSSFFSRERAKQGTRENYHAKCEAVDDERPT
jgi:hypothetical protein